MGENFETWATAKTGIDFLRPAEVPISCFNFEKTTVKKSGFRSPGHELQLFEEDKQVIDMSGSSRTDLNGRTTWRFTNYIHAKTSIYEFYNLDRPVSFVATPIADKPTYLTTVIKFEESQKHPGRITELVVEVYSWDKQGNPSPYVGFSWRCRVRCDEEIM